MQPSLRCIARTYLWRTNISISRNQMLCSGFALCGALAPLKGCQRYSLLHDGSRSALAPFNQMYDWIVGPYVKAIQWTEWWRTPRFTIIQWIVSLDCWLSSRVWFPARTFYASLFWFKTWLVYRSDIINPVPSARRLRISKSLKFMTLNALMVQCMCTRN